MKNDHSRFLKEISGKEKRKWRAQKQGMAVEIIENFLSSKMEMAEVLMDGIPEPEPRKGLKPKSTKQDSFASSFYSWKKRNKTQQLLKRLGIVDVLLIRRGERIALKKKRVKR